MKKKKSKNYRQHRAINHFGLRAVENCFQAKGSPKQALTIG